MLLEDLNLAGTSKLLEGDVIESRSGTGTTTTFNPEKERKWRAS